MKTRSHICDLYICNPAAYARGDFQSAFALLEPGVDMSNYWMLVGSITIDVPAELLDRCVQLGLEKIKERIEEEQDRHMQELDRLERAKQELLALPGPDQATDSQNWLSEEDAK